MEDFENASPFQLNADERKTYRIILWVGIIALPLFGLVYELTNPEAIEYFSHRLLISGLWLALFGLTFSKHPFLRKNLLLFIYVAFYVLSFWVIWIVFVNGFSYDYVVGLMLAFTCICALHKQPLALQLYILSFTGLSTVAILLPHITFVHKYLLIITVLTLGVVMYVILRSRLRAQENVETANQLLAEEIKAKEKLAKKLERSNEELERFAAVASHDLQAPLRKIQLFANRLQYEDKTNISERGLLYLDRMQHAAGRMQALVNDLLAYARIEQEELKQEEVNLNEVVVEVKSNLEVPIEEANARIESGPLPVIYNNRVVVVQLLQNLIANAIKFRQPERAARIEIRAEANGEGKVHFAVRDNGIGIESKHLQRIFRPFERLHGASEVEGSGIGLAFCRKVVEKQGGQIWAESRPGEGSVFHFTLPDAKPRSR